METPGRGLCPLQPPKRWRFIPAQRAGLSRHFSKLKGESIKNALPEAWNRIISEPDSVLSELLAETAERICGFPLEIAEVSQFLKKHKDQFSLLPQDEFTESIDSSYSRKYPPQKSSVQEISDREKITQDDLIPHIVQILKRHGGNAAKKAVEKEIYTILEDTFKHPWYQETVSYDIPRWKHNVAWAKERAKKRGLIKKPNESGRGIWALTEKALE